MTSEPSSALALMERTIKNWTHEELHGWTSGRQEIVWALEKIAVWDYLFVRATNILIPMALAENATNSNNAKGLLLSLFSVGLGWGPTQSAPSKRFPILQDLVRSTDSNRRSLGLELCKEWLSNHGGSRMIGAEYQGLKPQIEFWRPKTYGELYDYWRDALRFIQNEMKGFDVIDRNQAADVLVNAAQGFIDIKDLSQEVVNILFEIAHDHDINRKLLTQFVIWELRQRNEKLDTSTLARIRELDRLLTGDSLWDRTNRFVLHTNWDEDYTFNKEEYEELNEPTQRVQELAKEYMDDLNIFSKHLGKLVQESGHRLPELGMECGKLATSGFNDEIFNRIESDKDNVNGVFIGGYLAGLRTHDTDLWEAQLHHLLCSTEMREIAIDCIYRSGFTESLLNEMLNLLKQEKLKSTAFSRFNFGHEIKNIHDELFQEVVSTLLKHPNRSIELLSHTLSNMGRISRYGVSSYITKIADEIVISNPHESWKVITELLISESSNRYDIIYWLSDTGSDIRPHTSALNYISAKEIITWIKDDSEKRMWLIENILPKTLDKDSGGQLTQLFIEEFGEYENMDSSLFMHFHMGAWCGHESNHLSGIRDSARQWLSDIPSTKVQLWLGKFIDYLSNRIEAVQIQEEREF